MRILGIGALLLACTAAFTSTLALRVLGETGKPVTARVRILDAKGEPHAVAATGLALTAAHPNFPQLGAIVSCERVIQLPGVAYLRAWVEAEMDRMRAVPAEKLTPRSAARVHCPLPESAAVLPAG